MASRLMQANERDLQSLVLLGGEKVLYLDIP